MQVNHLFIDKIEFEEVNGPRILCGDAEPLMTSVIPVSLCEKLQLRVSEGHTRLSVWSDTCRLTVHVPVFEHSDFVIGKDLLILLREVLCQFVGSEKFPPLHMEGAVLSSSLELLSENRRHPEVITLDDSDDSPAASPMSRAVAHSPEDGHVKIKDEPSAKASPTSQEVTSLGAPEPSTSQGESFNELAARMAEEFFQRHEDEFRREPALSVPAVLPRLLAWRPKPWERYHEGQRRRAGRDEMMRELDLHMGSHPLWIATRRGQRRENRPLSSPSTSKSPASGASTRRSVRRRIDQP